MKKVLIMERNMILREGLLQVLQMEFNHKDLYLHVYKSNEKLIEYYDYCFVDSDTYVRDVEYINRLRMIGSKVVVFLPDKNTKEIEFVEPDITKIQAILLQTMKRSEMVQALTHIFEGYTYFHPLMAHTVIKKLKGSSPQHLDVSRGESEQSILSTREIDILQLLSLGHNNNEIAKKLQVSPLTINSHMRRIFRKFDVDNRVSALVYALKNDFIKIN
ncbi:response regulator transcription factor [Priestia koreensis]|uniref:response regulator transcription factor n=1 Tax=Priestia koreensis TaxID=284581 RepID=UPI00203F0B90|nr:response regulator transcription factor [Priestia koreensis]MCM3005839.1 response regulator transcription factor [Priestia koreensis]